MEKLESIVQFLDDYLEISTFPDFPKALNGLQVEASVSIQRVCVAVDASEETIKDAVDGGAQLLIVHHGLFWDEPSPVVGRSFRKLKLLIENELALYSAHLPLDAHAEVGNCAVMARKLDIPLEGRFGEYQGREIGWRGKIAIDRSELHGRLEALVGEPVKLIPGGPEQVRSVGLLTGGGGSMITEAAAQGLDTYITGEGAHHTYSQAMECGINVFYAGHYATEVWGVKALGALIEESFGVPWEFLDHPTGL